MDVDRRRKDGQPRESDRMHKDLYFPSCHELGIPMYCEDAPCSGDVIYGVYKNPFQEMPSGMEMPALEFPVSLDAFYEERSFSRHRRLIHSPSLQLDGIRYGNGRASIDPYSPTCMVPLPDHFGEPCFIRRRNERERERVRCVNEGYSRLKEHLPCEGNERRMSKVETLRGAIKYIRQLQRMLENDNNEDYNNSNNKSNNRNQSKTNYDHSETGSDTNAAMLKRRTSSLSSSDPDSPDSIT